MTKHKKHAVYAQCENSVVIAWRGKGTQSCNSE
jgi:hypothetical protein